MGANLDGIIIIDKPAGLTSHDVVARARRILHTRRIGHTGTLDPFATGVLVLCVGRLTRLAQFLSGEDKEYNAVVRLGSATETGDLTGKPTTQYCDPGHITNSAIRAVLDQFRGRIQQVPPMYAAKKVGGVKLYEMARRGEVIERKPVEVEVKEIDLVEAATQFLPPGDVALLVVCSAGTYIRTLAEEIGERLGVGAHLVELRRTRAGRCSIDSAITLDKLEELGSAGRLSEAFQVVPNVVGLPVLEVDQSDEGKVRNGAAIRIDAGKGQRGGRVLLSSGSGELLAVAEFDETKDQWQPRVVLTGAQ